MINFKITVGDFLDRMSIVAVKIGKIKDKRKEVLLREMDYFIKCSLEHKLDVNSIPEYFELVKLNKDAWNVIDKIRNLMNKKCTDKEKEKMIFYIKKQWVLNDKRAIVKKNINQKFNSDIYETKHYVNFKI